VFCLSSLFRFFNFSLKKKKKKQKTPCEDLIKCTPNMARTTPCLIHCIWLFLLNLHLLAWYSIALFFIFIMYSFGCRWCGLWFTFHFMTFHIYYFFFFGLLFCLIFLLFITFFVILGFFIFLSFVAGLLFLLVLLALLFDFISSSSSPLFSSCSMA